MPGPFFFAWANANEAFSPAHHVEDEEVYGFDLEHTEGDFPMLNITIRNPRVGLLAPGRKRWAWLSYNKTWTPGGDSESDTDVEPLFYGRLVAIPNDLDEELIQISFIARPVDFTAQKAAVAEAKKVAPYFDPIWFSPERLTDPDIILESRPELWHIDRVTHEVTTSHILAGEDGTEELGEDDVFYDSVNTSYGEAPLHAVDVKASVNWDQRAVGNVNLFGGGGGGGGGLQAGSFIYTYSGEGLIANWPKTGASMSGGYHVAIGAAVRVDGTYQPTLGWVGGWPDAPHNTFRDVIGCNPTPPLREGPHAICKQMTEEWSFFPIAKGPGSWLWIPRWEVSATLVAGYDVSRSYSEDIAFTLRADAQEILTNASDAETLTIDMSSSELASAIDPGGAMPIGDLRARSYFNTARGAESIGYLIAVASSRLQARARCVDVSMELSFEKGLELGLSCRKSLLLEDARLPGGQAAGKIKSYRISLDGQSGAAVCGLTIGCSIGRGNTVTEEEGEPDYVADGYVDDGYQTHTGRIIMPLPGVVTYTSQEGVVPDDDGIDFFRPNFLLYKRVTNEWQAQEDAADAAWIPLRFDYLTRSYVGEANPDPNMVFEAIDAVPTTYEWGLRPLEGGPFKTVYAPELSALMLPKTIDLEAPSTP